MSTYLFASIIARRRRNRALCMETRYFRIRDDAFNVPDLEFLKLYRLPKHLVVELCNLLGDRLAPISAAKTVLSVEVKVLCALNFFGTGSYQKTISQMSHVAVCQAAVSKAIRNVSKAINEKLLCKEISFPREEEYEQLKLGFLKIANFPNVIGALDCTHVSILAPSASDSKYPEASYYNKKEYHSVNVQMVCDSDLRIININARFPGSTENSYIWKMSLLREILEKESKDENKGWLLGAICYPLEPWLLTPVKNPKTKSEEHYNSAHLKTKKVIKRCFEVLKARFRCLSREKVLYYNPRTASLIVNACAVLHNLSIKHNLPLFMDAYVEDDDAMPQPAERSLPSPSAVFLRNSIIDSF